MIYTVKLVHIHRHDRFDRPITRDVRSGKGPRAEVGSRVVYRWKAWLVTGKTITSKMDNPATLDLVSDPYPSDIQRVLVGMQPGGIRRTLIREFHPFDHTGFGFGKMIMEIEVLSVVDGPLGGRGLQ